MRRLYKHRVWWVSNPPKEPFKYSVKNIEEAKLIIDVLTKYDLYLGDLINTNACGFETYQDGEWTEHYDEEGRDIQEIMEEEGR